MGTRSLIAVHVDKRYGVAQYNQWDGDPGGQGTGVLDFLKDMDKDKFIEKVRATKFATQEDYNRINTKHGKEWARHYPQMSRDTGSDILQMVQEFEPGIMLKNSIDFAGDSLMCEWAYVVDFDENALEVYKGFNKKPLDKTERFADTKIEGKEYYPVYLVMQWDLSALPSDEEFMAELNDDEDE